MPVAAGRRAALPRPAGEDRPRRDPLPHALRPALRLRPGRGHRVERAAEREVLFTSEGADRVASACAATCRSPSRTATPWPSSRCAPGETASFVLEESAARRVAVSPARRTTSPRRFKHDQRLLAPLDRALDLPRPLARDRQPLRAHAQAPHVAEHGSMVAAPTFGLPERLGGARNWDYRYTWIRDASFTLYALMRLGLHRGGARLHELDRGALRRAAAPTARSRSCTASTAATSSPRRSLDHLDGLRAARGRSASATPRTASCSSTSTASSWTPSTSTTSTASPSPTTSGATSCGSSTGSASNWREPDEGIWEVRGGRQEFLLSRLMCWVAVDRAIRLAHKRSLPAPARTAGTRCATHLPGHLRRASGTRRGRPSCSTRARRPRTRPTLLMPLMKFIGPTDPRWLSTLRAIESGPRRRLAGLPLPTAATRRPTASTARRARFNMCSFWYVECLARAGDVDQARFIFEKMLGYANHLGLYAEELGPRGEHLGQLPQAFTPPGAHQRRLLPRPGDGRGGQAALNPVEPMVRSAPRHTPSTTGGETA